MSGLDTKINFREGATVWEMAEGIYELHKHLREAILLTGEAQGVPPDPRGVTLRADSVSWDTEEERLAGVLALALIREEGWLSEAPRDSVVAEVLAERERQEAKWGVQDHDPIVFSAILSEECGELAQAALNARFSGDGLEALSRSCLDDVRTEAIQVAAVAVQIVEALDRGAWRWGESLRLPGGEA